MDLIKITTNENGENAVSGRELHNFLEVGTRYDKWFTRMTGYGFEECVDFVAIGQKRPTAQGNEVEFIDHVLTLDMAKEISMIQRNDKGKQARKYFIEVEKRSKQPNKPLDNTKLLLKAALEHEEKIEKLENKVETLEESMRISGAQELELNTLGRQKVVKCLGGKESHIYQKHSKKIFGTFWREFNKYFMIPRYSELPKSKFEEAKEFINEWQPPTSIRLQLKEVDNQLSLFEN